MSADLSPGDWVECVHHDGCAPGCAEPTFRPLVLGALYKVARFSTHPRYPTLPCVEVVGVPGQPYWIGRFRPIHRPSQSTLIEDLKSLPADLVEA